MILLCGLSSETPLVLVREALDESGIPYVHLDQCLQPEAELEAWIDGAGCRGRLRFGGREHALEDFRGVYSRWMEGTRVPEVARLPPGSPARARCQRFEELLTQWMEVTPARVVNRVSAMGSNASKPYQAQAIRRAGFEIPETLVSNDPTRVEAFLAQHGQVIYKSISGVRSIVQTLGPEDRERLERIRSCPVQFQEKVPGEDVRVHTVGGRVFATRILCRATDYRYARRETGEAAELEPWELPEEAARRCTVLAEELGLELAGIDLRRTPDGRFYCFEVNPSPAFSYYQNQTGQPIARAVAEHLAA